MSDNDREVVERELRRRAKQIIRKKMKGVRATLPKSASIARTEKITERVLTLEPLQSAQTVLTFASLEHEIDTRALIDTLHDQGKDVALPRVVDDGLVLHQVSRDTPLEPGSFSVPEPPEDAPVCDPSSIDFAFVPALAVDVRGFRIGYGGGYYDRLLPELVRASTCAIAFDFQLVAEVPEFPFDVAVDWVVTDTRTLDARRERDAAT